MDDGECEEEMYMAIRKKEEEIYIYLITAPCYLALFLCMGRRTMGIYSRENTYLLAGHREGAWRIGCPTEIWALIWDNWAVILNLVFELFHFEV